MRYFSYVHYLDSPKNVNNKNKAGPLWITSQLLNIVTVSLNSNESMNSCFVKMF